MSKNTMPEQYDSPSGVEEAPTKEEILMNENDILRGLIEAGREKDNENSYEKIQIRRGGVLKFEFRIRPLSGDETNACMDKASEFAPRKKGQPRRRLELDQAKFRSWMVYTATVDEDRKKTWDNKQAQEALGILYGPDMIDAVLLAGEKDAVLDRIDAISGFGDELESGDQIEDTAKN